MHVCVVLHTLSHVQICVVTTSHTQNCRAPGEDAVLSTPEAAQLVSRPPCLCAESTSQALSSLTPALSLEAT